MHILFTNFSYLEGFDASQVPMAITLKVGEVLKKENEK
jgi:hypothetical protein